MQLICTPHFELVEINGFHETLIGLYHTEAEAKAERSVRRKIWAKMRITHGVLVVRRRRF